MGGRVISENVQSGLEITKVPLGGCGSEAGSVLRCLCSQRHPRTSSLDFLSWPLPQKCWSFESAHTDSCVYPQSSLVLELFFPLGKRLKLGVPQ